MWLIAASLLFGTTSEPLSSADVTFLEQPSAYELLPLRTEIPGRGEVLVRCRIRADGWLRQCETIDLDLSPGRNDRSYELWFSRVASRFRVGSQTRDGQPVAGRLIDISMRWSFDRP